MSRSTPFFNTKAGGYRKSSPDTGSDFKYLHWSRQLELRPLRDQPRRIYEQGDFDTYIDMFDDNEIIERESNETQAE